MPGGFKERPADRVAELSKREADDPGQFMHSLVGHCGDSGFCSSDLGTLERCEQREDTTALHFYRNSRCWVWNKWNGMRAEAGRPSKRLGPHSRQKMATV